MSRSITFYVKKDWKDAHYTWSIGENGIGTRINSGDCIRFSDHLKSKVASVSLASKSNIEFCGVFADTNCATFHKLVECFDASKPALKTARSYQIGDSEVKNVIVAFKCFLKKSNNN